MPLPSPGHLPNPEIEPGSPALQGDSLPSKPPGTDRDPGQIQSQWLPSQTLKTMWINGLLRERAHRASGGCRPRVRGATPLPWGTHLVDAARPGPSLPRASSRESQQPLPGGDPAPSLRDSHLRAQGKRPNARGAQGCETLLSAWASGHPARLPVMHANKKQGSRSPGGGPGRWVGCPREPVKKALVGWGPETETQQPRVPIPAR